MSRTVKPLLIRCQNMDCQELYTITLSSNPERHEHEMLFANCPHCRQARSVLALAKYWGKPRCWGCQIPFEIIKEYSHGMCYTCYKAKWKQRSNTSDIPKEEEDATLFS